MWGKTREQVWSFVSLRLSCSSKPSQVASESAHGAYLGAAGGGPVGCDACVEENNACKCSQSLHGEQHAEANSSFAHSVINMVGMLIGLGQLSTPYALETGGWSSVFLLVGLGILCAYTSHVLGKCVEKNPKSKSFTDIGENAFGRKGKAISAGFIYLEIFMALVSYTISLHDNLTVVFANASIKLSWVRMSTSQLLTTMAVLIALPSLWLRDLSSISFLSSGGILMSVVIFLSVVFVAVFGGVKANHAIEALHLSKLPAISGLYMFSYAGHIVFPNIYKAMRDPSKFTKVCIVSFGLVTALYTSLAFIGAKLFGSQVNPQITLSMPPHLVATKIALWATVLTPMTKYALEFAPFAMQLEHNLPSALSRRTKMVVRGSVGSVLLLIILALALSVPYFEHVLSLTGSLVSVAICVIFPCAFYLKIYWHQLSTPLMLLNLFFIAIGVTFAALGTFSSFSLLINSLRRSH